MLALRRIAVFLGAATCFYAQDVAPLRSRTADAAERARLEAASRFLSQATLGANYEEIVRTVRMGREAWLAEQFAQTPSWHVPMTRHMRALVGERGKELLPPIFYRRISWWQQAMTGSDLLRQRERSFVARARSDPSVNGQPATDNEKSKIPAKT